MAKMMPASMQAEAPKSERSVFEALRGAADSEAWRVLHSQGFCNSASGRYGEIDFVVVAPEVGIVCIEVKGGGVSCTDGAWSTRDAGGATFALKRSPFRQAQEGMWKLQKAILDRFGAGSHEAACPIGWLVVLPDVTCPPPGTEFTRNDVIDRNDMRSDIGQRIRSAPSIKALLENTGTVRPSKNVRDAIVSFLRPDFERITQPATDRADMEDRIRVLTEEQYATLDAIDANQICLIRGPAGTGKTMLAVEQARRMASAGKRVVLTCFNRNLGFWMQEVVGRQAAPNAGPVLVGNIHRILNKYVGPYDQINKPETADQDKFDVSWFEQSALSILDTNERFDVVIVDEVQDIPQAGLAQVINAWTIDVPDRRILLMGDFTRQAIYGSDKRSEIALGQEFPSIPTFDLKLNCRNTKSISIQMGILAGHFGTRISDRQSDGDPVETMYFRNRAEAIILIERILKSLRDAAFPSEEIVILGVNRKRNSILSEVVNIGDWTISDGFGGANGTISYSTIHAFKGLESCAIILLDPFRRDADEADSLLYVGMSRARIRLFLVCDENHRSMIDQRVLRHINNMTRVA